jgi:hypothetical protein
MNTMLGFLAAVALFVFCAFTGDKDNPRTAPVAARARAIFPIRFVIFVITFCKAQFDSRKQVESKKADTEKRRMERHQNYPGACCSHLLFCRSELDHFTE